MPLASARPIPLALNSTKKTSVPPIPSLLSIPVSPAVPCSPLAPPPGLNQRQLLPSPPLSPHLLAQPPSTPYPWIWRCHLCHSVYRLGVTRRCLEDGHYFCSLPSPPPSPSPTFSVLSSLSLRSKKTRHAPRGCRAEFDYSGWATYNMWRRERRYLQLDKMGIKDDDSATAKHPDHPDGAKDCWRDCDFPSECHTYLRLQQQQQLAAASVAAAMGFGMGFGGTITPPLEMEEGECSPVSLPEEDWEKDSMSPSPSPSPPTLNAVAMTSALSYTAPQNANGGKGIHLTEALKEMELQTEELESEVYYHDMDLSSSPSAGSYSGSDGSSPHSKDTSPSSASSISPHSTHEGTLVKDEEDVSMVLDAGPPTMDAQEMEVLRDRRQKSLQKIKELTGLLLTEGDLGLGLGLGLGFGKTAPGREPVDEPGSPLKKEVFFGSHDDDICMDNGLRMGLAETDVADQDVTMVYGGRLG